MSVEEIHKRHEAINSWRDYDPPATMYEDRADLLELVGDLVKALRGEVISGHYRPDQPSGPNIVRHSCDLCCAFWNPGDPEFHMESCVLSKVPSAFLKL